MTSMENILEYKNQCEEYLSKRNSCLSVHSFASIYLWKDFFNFTWDFIDSNLCIFAKNDIGTFLYLPPLGERISLQAVQSSFARMKGENRIKGVARIENVSSELIKFFPQEYYEAVKKCDEYLYERKNIVELKGNDYKSKRHDVNHFLKSHSSAFRIFQDKDLSGCIRLYDQWASDRREKYNDPVFHHMLDENRIVHELALKSQEVLNLQIRVVEVEGEIKAYTAGYSINEEVFCVLLEIADLNMTGLSTYIFREFCDDDVLKPYAWINVMDDFAVPNLKRTKMSFHPQRIEEVFIIKEKRT